MCFFPSCMSCLLLVAPPGGEMCFLFSCMSCLLLVAPPGGEMCFLFSCTVTPSDILEQTHVILKGFSAWSLHSVYGKVEVSQGTTSCSSGGPAGDGDSGTRRRLVMRTMLLLVATNTRVNLFRRKKLHKNRFKNGWFKTKAHVCVQCTKIRWIKNTTTNVFLRKKFEFSLCRRTASKQCAYLHSLVHHGNALVSTQGRSFVPKSEMKQSSKIEKKNQKQNPSTVLPRYVWSLFGLTRRSSPWGNFSDRWIESINQA